MVLDIYNNFCYRAFNNGILKKEIDESEWIDIATLLHEMKIDQEDELVRVIEMDEKTQGFGQNT
jgi:hypothetical protein